MYTFSQVNQKYISVIICLYRQHRYLAYRSFVSVCWGYLGQKLFSRPVLCFGFGRSSLIQMDRL